VCVCVCVCVCVREREREREREWKRVKSVTERKKVKTTNVMNTGFSISQILPYFYN